MAKSVLDCVIGALDDLSADNFQRFKVKLCEPREIKYGQIEKESKVEVAQRIVSVFTNDGAVNQTADVLRAIGLNGEADALEREGNEVNGGEMCEEICRVLKFRSRCCCRAPVNPEETREKDGT